MKLSVIIPAFKEPLLQQTIDSLFVTSGLGDQLEILVVLDGEWLMSAIKEDSRVKLIQLPHNLGMRGAINAGLKEARGEYIMKVDAHCMFDTAFDLKMLNDCQENRLLVPRRYSLDDVRWRIDTNRPSRDYHYYEYPYKTKYGMAMSVLDWDQPKKAGIFLDDTMAFQGSCWMANREYFMKHVGYLDDSEATYGTFVGEQHEIGLKYWLGDGEIKVNKKTWYAHLAKRMVHYASGKYDRLRKSAPDTEKYHTWVSDHWMNDKEPGMLKSFSWLIKRFSPVPSWPKNYGN